MKEAIILAGGFGTRLQGVLKELPKPMAPVHDRPFLTYVLDHLIQFGYDHVVLSTGYLHEKIEAYFDTQYKSLEIRYAREQQPLGTGGAIRFASTQCHSEDILVLNGDTLFLADLQAFEETHRRRQPLLSIVLRQVDDVSRYGSVVVDDNQRITQFTEKGACSGSGTINGGIYLVRRTLFNKYPQAATFSFEKEIMERYYLQEPFYTFLSDGYFIDIGIPEDYARAQHEL